MFPPFDWEGKHAIEDEKIRSLYLSTRLSFQKYELNSSFGRPCGPMARTPLPAVRLPGCGS